jgi:AhpD family alkylhydroperoxidase
MAQLPYIEIEEADPVTKAVYDKAEARFQMVLNIFKITGNAPEIGSKMWDIFFEILRDGRVDWPTKELLILKATKMGDCLYCVTQHEVVSERLGISPEKQADIVGVEYRRARTTATPSGPSSTSAPRSSLTRSGSRPRRGRRCAATTPTTRSWRSWSRSAPTCR